MSSVKDGDAREEPDDEEEGWWWYKDKRKGVRKWLVQV